MADYYVDTNQDTIGNHYGYVQGHTRRPRVAPLDVTSTSASAHYYPHSQPSSAIPVSATSYHQLEPSSTTTLSSFSLTSAEPSPVVETASGVPAPAPIVPPPPPMATQETINDDGAQRKKSRKRPKIREHVPLSANQPLTSQGKERIRVYLACAQW
jgi:hypothetical protein